MLEAMLMLAIGAVVGVVIGAVVMSLSRGKSDVIPLVPPQARQSVPPPLPTPLPREEIDGQVLAVLREENTIAAIKRARELTGWNLREAKQYVEELARRNFISRQDSRNT
jgi:ribosomal protein L7/L12